MGKAQDNLGALLVEAGWMPKPAITLPRGCNWIFDPELLRLAQSMFHALGGTDEKLWRPGPWDLCYRNGLVELDEEQHFNRYRATTLTSPFYSHVPTFPRKIYTKYCIDNEPRCLGKCGQRGYWSTPSADKMFGLSSSHGELSIGSGSSRWKQRAFNDLLKDISPFSQPLRLARIAVWDTVVVHGKRELVGKLLIRPRTTALVDAILNLLESRWIEPGRL